MKSLQKLNNIEKFAFTDVQAQSIVDMRLRALTGLERKKIEDEYSELQKKISGFLEILGDRKKLLGVIKEEIKEIAEKYGDDRKTVISHDVADIDTEDLIADDRMIITLSHLGYIKRMDEDNFKQQNRGGKGIKGTQNIDDDYVEDMLMTTNHYYIMFFTNMGKVYRIKSYEIPEASRTSRGTAIVNILPLQSDEKISAVIAISEKEFENDRANLIMATKNGMIKKTALKEYANVRKNGLNACSLREGDELIEVKFTAGDSEILMVSAEGMAIRISEEDIRQTGRVSIGVIGMRLNSGDSVIAMQTLNQGKNLLVVSEYGMGKQTPVSEFHTQGRGGKGILCYKVNDKTGRLVAAKLIDEGTDILLITNRGQMMRTAAEDISVIGRNTSGVKIMNIDRGNDEYIASIAKAVRIDDTEEKNEENEEIN